MKEIISETKINKLFGVEDKVVLIVGAGGMGEYFAKGFADNGAKVIVTNRTEAKAAATKEKLAAAGLNVDAVAMDATVKEDVEKAVAAIVEKYGRIDVLLNTAGVGAHAAPEDYEEEIIRKIIDTNLMGAIFVSQVVGKVMINQQYGHIIHISSTASKTVATLESTPYGVSKAGLNMLVQNLGVIWAKHNINVNAICPTWTWSPMTELLDQSYVAEINELCGGRMCRPEDLLGTALFLASDASHFVNGQAIVVDNAMYSGKMLKSIDTKAGKTW